MGEGYKFDALESVRRLIRTGNNKSFWRKREQELLAEIAKATLTEGHGR